MHLGRTKPALLSVLVAFVAAFFTAAPVFAEGEYTLTGTAIRVKTIAFIDINVYSIAHYMKQPPPSRSKKAVIEADTAKKFTWMMLRDVDHEKIVGALKDAYAMNGYADSAKIGKFIGAFKGELKERSNVSIVYDADRKVTTVSVGGASATVEGVDFMKATWSIWFGKIDQPKLGDQLMSKLP